jgi:hypothetical protein
MGRTISRRQGCRTNRIHNIDILWFQGQTSIILQHIKGQPQRIEKTPQRHTTTVIFIFLSTDTSRGTHRVQPTTLSTRLELCLQDSSPTTATLG